MNISDPADEPTPTNRSSRGVMLAPYRFLPIVYAFALGDAF